MFPQYMLPFWPSIFSLESRIHGHRHSNVHLCLAHICRKLLHISGILLERFNSIIIIIRATEILLLIFTDKMHLSSEQWDDEHDLVTQAEGMTFLDIKIDFAYHISPFFNFELFSPCTEMENAFIYLLTWPIRLRSGQ